MGEEQKNPNPWSQIFLGVVAVLLFVAAVFGSFKGLNEAVAILLIVAGAGLAILAAFWSRIQGTVEFTKDGAKIPIGAASRAEQQLQQGKVVDATETVGIVDAFEAVLSQHGARAVEHGQPREIAPPQQQQPQQEEPTAEPPRWRLGRNVQLVDDAVVTMATLTNQERVQVQTEIARMSHPDFREELDPRAIWGGDQGRSYRVHKVPDSNLRLWYRPLNEDHPETLVVMVIEKD